MTNLVQLQIQLNTLNEEYRVLYETFLKATGAMDGDKLARETRRDLNIALDKAARRFNADALKASQAAKGV